MGRGRPLCPWWIHTMVRLHILSHCMLEHGMLLPTAAPADSSYCVCIVALESPCLASFPALLPPLLVTRGFVLLRKCVLLSAPPGWYTFNVFTNET